MGTGGGEQEEEHEGRCFLRIALAADIMVVRSTRWLMIQLIGSV